MRVSVYMPTRNRAALLERAVESVLAQTHEDLELIVVDDASVDDTAPRLAAWAARDARMRVLRNDVPAGGAAARNRAVREATSDFVTGLDDDDWFHSERLRGFVDRWRALEARGEHPSCLYSHEVAVDGDARRPVVKPERVEWSDLFSRFYNPMGNQVFAKRASLVAAGLYDESLPAWQDLDLWIRLLRAFGPARLCDQSTYFMDVSPRPDRLSLLSKARIIEAFRRVSSKHPDVHRSLRQALYLQVFGSHYGFQPTLVDMTRFLSLGLCKRNLAQMIHLWRQRRDGVGRAAA